MSDNLTEDGEYKTIYLSPHCGKCRFALLGYDEGFSWCSEPQEPCEECGKDWVEYRIAKEPNRD